MQAWLTFLFLVDQPTFLKGEGREGKRRRRGEVGEGEGGGAGEGGDKILCNYQGKPEKHP